MKKLWKNYSNAILLILLSFITSIILKINLPSSDQYKTITIREGESLWKIAQQYKKEHGMTEKQFINWVEKYNGISRDYIVSGEYLVLPITENPKEIGEIMELQELASNTEVNQ